MSYLQIMQLGWIVNIGAMIIFILILLLETLSSYMRDPVKHVKLVNATKSLPKRSRIPMFIRLLIPYTMLFHCVWMYLKYINSSLTPLEFILKENTKDIK